MFRGTNSQVTKNPGPSFYPTRVQCSLALESHNSGCISSPDVAIVPAKSAGKRGSQGSSTAAEISRDGLGCDHSGV